MGIRVLLSGLEEQFYCEAIKNLVRHDNWEPCYCISKSKILKNEYPGTVFHYKYDAILGIPPYEFLELELRPVDQPLLKELAFYEHIVLKMMDRMDPYNIFTYSERLQLYYFQLKYWLTILEKLTPTIVVFHTTPHMLYDYIIYILSRKKGIKTIMFLPTVFTHINFAEESYEEALPVVGLYKKLLTKEKTTSVSLSRMAEEYLNKVRSCNQDDAKPARSIMKEKMSESNIIDGLRLGALYEYLYDLYGILASVKLPPRPHFVKRKGVKLQKGPYWSRFEYSLYKFRFKLKKRKLISYYKNIAQTPDLSVPFVYMSLHNQPERSTSPMGDYYVDQSLIVEILSKAVPKGWLVYVKEHPFQFSPKFAGECGRSYEYYDNIASLPNVKFMPFSFQSYTLIDNAQAVVAGIGTTGFEAVIRGTPAITFGHAWYNGCEGVYHIVSYEDCKRVLREIETGRVVDYEKVRLFVDALEKTGYNFYANERERPYSCISYEDCVKEITRGIRETCKSI